MAHDVRAIANIVLEIGESENREISNLSLNKILYFLHAGFLLKYGEPLVSAKIEAWDHGPVFREIYHQFKKFNKNPITEKAKKLDPLSGEFREVNCALRKFEIDFINESAFNLIKLSASKLVDMSHVRDGPWYAARFGQGYVNPGVEITDELILLSAQNKMRH